ncbi:hypothetical protein U14_00686 [Candidatus Moduliflexus flocculans]|uniref:RXYLT1 C-terminal domain-containing protein n=1 Tax=Candidatus Moduliflexus flocculans TaxID=1499966 RepID=A0A0S6VQG3_9BACT|nr:hypothetical protein U14_00686 [Candidatus Moduliflexus flocculans]
MNIIISNDNSDVPPSISRRHKVLFIRSHNKVFGSAIIAGGLRMMPHVDFAQYPLWPSHYRATLKKLDDPELAWEDLQVNALHNPQMLAAQLRDSFYDVILLADHNARLFQQHHAGVMTTLKIWRNLFRNIRSNGMKNAWRDYQYLTSIHWTIAELCRFAPVAVIDFIDPPYLTSGDIDLLEYCQLYFKREIPYDRFILYHQNHQRTKSFSAEKKITLLNKVHGIPLGIRDQKFQTLQKLRTTPQDIDIFWCGKISNTLRITAVKYLQELSLQKSWKIVILEKQLTFDEYCRLIARSKITISIAGAGWDCFRHYEAVALGSLPLINRPTVDSVWWHNLPEEIFFENHFLNFAVRLETLLADDALRHHLLNRVETMIQTNALWSKIVEYILDTSLLQHYSR